MVDISTVWDVNNIRGDWIMAGADLSATNDLSTAVLISLFTDRVAEPTDVIPDGTADPRGWWGDNQPNGISVPIGSRLWLLTRSKRSQKVLNDAVTYAREALQWMIDDGVAAAIDVQASWQGPQFLAMVVTIFRRNGTQMSLNYKWAWEQIS